MEVKLIIDRFEGDRAVLKSENNETIVWPKSILPDNAREGLSLTFTVKRTGEGEEDGKNLAKNILNEILKPE